MHVNLLNYNIVILSLFIMQIHKEVEIVKLSIVYDAFTINIGICIISIINIRKEKRNEKELIIIRVLLLFLFLNI